MYKNRGRTLPRHALAGLWTYSRTWFAASRSSKNRGARTRNSDQVGGMAGVHFGDSLTASSFMSFVRIRNEFGVDRAGVTVGEGHGSSFLHRPE